MMAIGYLSKSTNGSVDQSFRRNSSRVITSPGFSGSMARTWNGCFLTLIFTVFLPATRQPRGQPKAPKLHFGDRRDLSVTVRLSPILEHRQVPRTNRHYLIVYQLSQVCLELIDSRSSLAPHVCQSLHGDNAKDTMTRSK